jgi:hypothetical protein
MNELRKEQILEKLAGLPSPLKGRLIQTLKTFSPEIRKSVLHGAPVPKGAEGVYEAAMKAAKRAATSPSEAAQLQSHLAGRKAAGQISRTTFSPKTFSPKTFSPKTFSPRAFSQKTFFPKTRARPLIQEGRAAKQNFKQLRAQEQLAKADSKAKFRRNLALGAGGLGLAGLGYLALKNMPQEQPEVADSGGSWG